MPVSNENEVSRSIKELAEKRIQEFIVGRIPSGNAIATFLSLISKESATEISTLCVASTRMGAVLFYNPEFILSLSDPELMFAATHEFAHLACDTFAREMLIRSKYPDISSADFNRKVAPYFDIIVNDMLNHMPGFVQLNERSSLLHSGADSSIVPVFMRHKRTLEDLASIIHDNFDKVPALELSEIPFILSHSNAEPGDLDEISNVLKTSMQTDVCRSIPGSISQMINHQDIIRKTLSQSLSSKKLWSRLTQYVRSTRAAATARKRSMRRINRRTLLPPGRVFDRGFSVLFLLDESGSVSDSFIRFAFTMVEHAALGDKSDEIYVAHWDTELIRLEKVEKKKKPDLRRETCGGTAFSTIYTNQDLKNLKIDLCVVVTDGECSDWPTGTPPYPTIWIINTHNGFDTWKSQCNTGIGMYVPKDTMV